MKSMAAELTAGAGVLQSLGNSASGHAWAKAYVMGVADSGHVEVRLADGALLLCDVLESVLDKALATDDAVLVLVPVAKGEVGVIVGGIVRYKPAPPRVPSHLSIEAAESLTLKCGEASIDLRADDKVMVRGEDVLLRAKGTQRIRAGNVAIN